MDDHDAHRRSREAGPKITQEMIDLYDEYTHVTLDRRGFMDKLATLAGSAAAAAAIAPMIASNAAQAAVVAVDDSRLKVEDVTFRGPAGDLKGHFAMPANATGKLPAVLVIHENRGLNAHIKDVARRFAVEGYAALAPDLLSRLGGTPANEEEGAKLFQQADRAGLMPDMLAFFEHLRRHPAATGKVGAIGFCFGGGIVNQLAVASPDLAAAVPFYGSQPPAADVPKIKAKLQLHYAGLDQRINAGIPGFVEALKKAGVEYELFTYDGANHAFFNDTSAARYDKAAAELAWSRVLAFFRRTLA